MIDFDDLWIKPCNKVNLATIAASVRKSEFFSKEFIKFCNVAIIAQSPPRTAHQARACICSAIALSYLNPSTRKEGGFCRAIALSYAKAITRSGECICSAIAQEPTIP
jgi:hypothetical protein